LSELRETVDASAVRRSLSDTDADRVVAAALADARQRRIGITVACLDEGANLKRVARMDGAPLVSIDTATAKARAAVLIGMPPDDFYTAIKDDPAAVLSFGARPGLALIAGGLPITSDGVVIGAIGVAGAMTGLEDRDIAQVALTAIDGDAGQGRDG
jgi:uncharacterized protein GlcG (DUF336 family)